MTKTIELTDRDDELIELQIEGDLARERTDCGMAGGGFVVSNGVNVVAKQGIAIRVGVSERVSGSYGLSMQKVVIPPGASCKAHIHVGSETALYVISGRAVNYFGPGLTQCKECGPGDFIYIAPGLPHCAHNMSEVEPVIAITARTDANDQERVQLYDVDAYYR